MTELTRHGWVHPKSLLQETVQFMHLVTCSSCESILLDSFTDLLSQGLHVLRSTDKLYQSCRNRLINYEQRLGP